MNDPKYKIYWYEGKCFCPKLGLQIPTNTYTIQEFDGCGYFNIYGPYSQETAKAVLDVLNDLYYGRHL